MRPAGPRRDEYSICTAVAPGTVITARTYRETISSATPTATSRSRKAQPDLSTRIALVPRSGDGPPVFAELDPFWVWHFANAYEDGGQVVADFRSWSELSMAAGDRRAASGQRTPVRGQFSRVSIDPVRGAATVTQVGEQASEFPRIDDRLTGRRHRYLTVGAASGQHDLARGEHDRLIRWDMSTGQSQVRDTDASIGEVIFVPRDGAAAELDGYYMMPVRRAGRCRSARRGRAACSMP